MSSFKLFLPAFRREEDRGVGVGTLWLGHVHWLGLSLPLFPLHVAGSCTAIIL